MLGSLLSRTLLCAFGYIYPAYECFKAVEKNVVNKEHLMFWCRYWILVALLTVLESFGDIFISWLPLYDEAKLTFFIYLWHPKTRGALFVYNAFVRPYVTQHEREIDRRLMECWTRCKDIAVEFLRNGATYSQAKLFEILRYVSSQQAATVQKTKLCADTYVSAERHKIGASE